MRRGILFIAGICTFTAIISGKRDGKRDGLRAAGDLYEALSSDIQNELADHANKLGKEFHENVMGERLHQVYDFRVIILANSHQCYYQEAENRTTISMNYECVNSPSFVSSAKVSAVAILIGEGGDHIASNDEAKSGEIEFQTEKEGIHGLCFNNEDSRNPASVQIQIDIWRHREVLRFYKEQEGKDDPLYKSKLRVFQVTRMIALIRHAIKHTLSMLRYDYLTILSNQSRVNNFSLLSFVLIASVCFIQLRVVKRMFGNQRTKV